MMRRLLFVLFAVMFAFSLGGCEYIMPTEDGQLQSDIMDTRTILRQANVGVEVEYREDGRWFSRRAGEAQGSGIIIGKDEENYYAITNFHVVDQKDYDDIIVEVVPSYYEDTRITAEILYEDADRDLALLRFSQEGLELGILDIMARKDDSLTRGELLLAVGNPSAVNSIVTYGEYLGMVDNDHVDFQVVYHSVLIYPGSSGGALADAKGNLIGVNTWSASADSERNMAVPLSEIHAFLAEADFDITLDTGG